MAVWGVIIGCGKSEEIGQGMETAFLSLGPRPVIGHSLAAFERCPDIDRIMLVVDKERIERAANLVRMMGCTKVTNILAGRRQRRANLERVLEQAGDEKGVYLLHEASRPMVDQDVLGQTVKAAKRYGAAVAANLITEPLKFTAQGKKVKATAEKNTVWIAQTPQAFKHTVLSKALAHAARKKISWTEDESAIVESSNQPVHLVESPASNFKIRSSEDLHLMARH
ncbi:IspD/TarI family cytidylyltransferase [Kiritimatiella glycovorans]|uniref:2-C-methyl-D-erythritol 4-phosphate cytidylyltransferase n=1 Tax=Kiritimatiella glycovorans TaxID=1307763 RepID=A0A0G3EG08_9BACT|nr:2-C-methyl-D-erythritol 4-phosphate cytidylyltransferase [Kiritimatiella glycovorans]AKJ64307.1 2-C-methyl-D-erythritol 4-phosphate cytidylyltransferase [Kiritimatiella glycovorans]